MNKGNDLIEFCDLCKPFHKEFMRVQAEEIFKALEEEVGHLKNLMTKSAYEKITQRFLK